MSTRSAVLPSIIPFDHDQDHYHDHDHDGHTQRATHASPLLLLPLSPPSVPFVVTPSQFPIGAPQRAYIWYCKICRMVVM